MVGTKSWQKPHFGSKLWQKPTKLEAIRGINLQNMFSTDIICIELDIRNWHPFIWFAANNFKLNEKMDVIHMRQKLIRHFLPKYGFLHNLLHNIPGAPAEKEYVCNQGVLDVTLTELKSAEYFDLRFQVVNGFPQPPAQKLSGRPWNFVAIGISPGTG